MITDSRRADESVIQARLLKACPPGTSAETVLAYVQRQGWSYRTLDRGFYDQRARPPRVVGVASLEADLGDYRSVPIPLSITSTRVHWGFDEQRRLMDIWVWKTTDGP